jgi:hypothetical protein
MASDGHGLVEDTVTTVEGGHDVGVCVPFLPTAHA